MPNFGQDTDVRATDNSISWAEKKLIKKWVPVLKSDLPKPGAPVFYSDETQGLDSDIKSSIEHLNFYENLYGRWDLPHDHANVQTKPQSIVQVRSDPICDSSGCNQYKHPENKEPDPVLYDFDPRYEGEILHNQQSLDAAEKIQNHEWVYKKAAPGDPPTTYDFDPDLDEDIKDVQEFTAKAEAEQAAAEAAAAEAAAKVANDKAAEGAK